MITSSTEESFDALVVGAGFGGIYQLYSLRQLGLSVKLIDVASDVGGTWYWNRYPGAMSDTESFVYRYTWDAEDLQTYPWSHHYVKQPEVLAYLKHVVQRHDLRKHMQFNTKFLSADWSEAEKVWNVDVSTGARYKVRYLITALGLLSRQNYPDIPGIDSFSGVKCHTSTWDPSIDLKDKRVGVIGCGSTGVQVITAIAGTVRELVCFQRHPQYSVPSGDGPVSPEYRAEINANYDKIVKQNQSSAYGFGFVESDRSYDSFSPEEREQMFESLWKRGNGFRFFGSGFSDLSTNRAANEAACEFIRKKIAQIVKDPVKAQKLQPHEPYARRPLCDGGYYEKFNRDNVFLVDLKETPIAAITPKGIKTSDGKEHELDVIIFATGFDAVDGQYKTLNIRGQDGKSLKEHWENGATSVLGTSIAHFPNFFIVAGPQTAFSSMPVLIEATVDFITGAIKRAEELSVNGKQATIEATEAAEIEWTKTCKDLVEGSLFKETDSWIFGRNIPGKPYSVTFYFGGLGRFRTLMHKMIEEGYPGYKPFLTS
ncbi:cyclohexanone monooxygenase [Grosmannia clavigera kw1407]|uniref:Cyclohexanone monooxygenase n=1 Tax=Grosmannia clavigera (strain kw1407 / UAMH 11150) TaxID=655863 RepID=F0X7M6_GROCL|nr:cyclohexanone monooxygenase [Grosmannia clavigera kw1407]EFX06506.1 cyclohexanone monooxygenase [Grosmannia clavigera kw1407]